MPKIDVAKAEVRKSSTYPEPFQALCVGREKTRIGDVAGLTQFGVNITRIKPGAASSVRHWHENEDELIYMLEGELVLVEDDGETILRAGDAAGWKAGVPNGHHLINRAERDALYLEIGTRAKHERAHYPDADLAAVRDEQGGRFTRKSGEPY